MEALICPIVDVRIIVLLIHTDAAVVSGMLTWKAVPESGRTAVHLTLTLTLLLSHYPNITSTQQVGVTKIPIPGELHFGDGVTNDRSDEMGITFVDVTMGYFVAVVTVLHHYTGASLHGNPWLSKYQYCCRGTSLINNKGTM